MASKLNGLGRRGRKTSAFPGIRVTEVEHDGAGPASCPRSSRELRALARLPSPRVRVTGKRRPTVAAAFRCSRRARVGTLDLRGLEKDRSSDRATGAKAPLRRKRRPGPNSALSRLEHRRLVGNDRQSYGAGSTSTRSALKIAPRTVREPPRRRETFLGQGLPPVHDGRSWPSHIETGRRHARRSTRRPRSLGKWRRLRAEGPPSWSIVSVSVHPDFSRFWIVTPRRSPRLRRRR